MKDKIFEIAKKHKITFKELGCKGLSSTYLTKIKKGHNSFKEKHLPLLVDSFNRIFRERNIDKTITIEDLHITPKQELDQLITESIISKTIYSIKQQEEIELFEKQKEVHSCKYRYIIGKYNQKIGNKEKALKIYHDLLNNFSCSSYLYSILIEITRIEKAQNIYQIYLKYQRQINKAPSKTRALLAYNTGIHLLRTAKWNKAVSCFEVLIGMPKITKHYYHSYNSLGICYQNLGKHEKAIEYFKKSVSDPTNYKELKICYVNVLSCAKKINYEPLIINTLKKLETILKNLKGEVFYQTYWNIGKTYLFLDNKTKAIEAFEKEIFFKIDLHNSSFHMGKHLESIKYLVKLYGNNPIKQKKLIRHIKKIELKHLDSEFIIYILKYYVSKNMEELIALFIKNINL